MYIYIYKYIQILCIDVYKEPSNITEKQSIGKTKDYL